MLALEGDDDDERPKTNIGSLTDRPNNWPLKKEMEEETEEEQVASYKLISKWRGGDAIPRYLNMNMPILQLIDVWLACYHLVEASRGLAGVSKSEQLT